MFWNTIFFSCKSSKIRAIICVLGRKKTGKKSKGVVDGIKMAEKELGLGKNQVLFYSVFGGGGAPLSAGFSSPLSGVSVTVSGRSTFGASTGFS